MDTPVPNLEYQEEGVTIGQSEVNRINDNLLMSEVNDTSQVDHGPYVANGSDRQKNFSDKSDLSILCRKKGGIVIAIRSGPVVNRLQIYWPVYEKASHSIACGGADGSLQTWVLDQNERIDRISGEKCTFDGTRVVGKLTIKTTKRQIGPVGFSGDPNGDNQDQISGPFDIDMTKNSLGMLVLESDKTKRFLGGIYVVGQYPMDEPESLHFSDTYRLSLAQNEAFSNDVFACLL